jgi:hypothetical protein
MKLQNFAARARWRTYLMMLVLRPSKTSLGFIVAIEKSDHRVETEK